MDFAEQNVPFNFADSRRGKITLFGQQIWILYGTGWNRFKPVPNLDRMEPV